MPAVQIDAAVGAGLIIFLWLPWQLEFHMQFKIEWITVLGDD